MPGKAYFIIATAWGPGVEGAFAVTCVRGPNNPNTQSNMKPQDQKDQIPDNTFLEITVVYAGVTLPSLTSQQWLPANLSSMLQQSVFISYVVYCSPRERSARRAFTACNVCAYTYICLQPVFRLYGACLGYRSCQSKNGGTFAAGSSNTHTHTLHLRVVYAGRP